MEIGHVKFIRPAIPLLQKWIKGYYVHASPDANFYSKVTFYQNITTTISIYRNSVTTAKGRYRTQHFERNNRYTQLLVGLVDKYQEVTFHGPLNRLAIVFYPGGINHFLNQPLSILLQLHFSMFDAFGESFERCLDVVYDTPSLERKRDLMDAFLMERYRSFEFPEILKAIDLLQHNTEPIKVSALAHQLNMNRRTLLRRFKKHLGYSLEEYTAVIRFRKALLNFQKQKDTKHLSKIALDSQYYDQADFNHHIKYRSDLTPKQLFEKLEIVDDILFWKL